MSTELVDVQMPDGTIVSGVPKGISQAEVMRRYQASQPAYGGKTLEQRQAESRAAFDAAQVPWYSRYFNQAGLDKAKEMAGNVVTGIPQAVTGIPATVVAAKDALNAALLHGNLQPAEQMATSVTNPVMTPLKQAIELAKPGLVTAPTPDAPETTAAAQGAGALLGGAAIGEAGEGGPHIVEPTANLFDAAKARMAAIDPTALKATAEALRNAKPVTTPSYGIVADAAIKPAVGVYNLGKKITNTVGAAARERLASAVDARYPAVQGNMVIGPNELAGASEQQSPVQGPSFPPPKEPAPLPKVDIVRPETQLPARDTQAWLDNLRSQETPQQAYDRMRMQQNTEIPAAETPETAGIPKPEPETITPGKLSVWDQLRRSKIPESTPESASLNKQLGLSARDVEHGADAGSQIIYEKLLGPDKPTTKLNVDAALKDSGTRLDGLLKSADEKGYQIDAQTPTYDAHANAQKIIGKSSDKAFEAKTQGIVDDMEARAGDIAKETGHTLEKLSPGEAFRLKSELGDSINWKTASEAYDAPENQMKIQIYRALNKQLKAIPDLGPEQYRWGNLKIGSDALGDSINDYKVGKGSLEFENLK